MTTIEDVIKQMRERRERAENRYMDPDNSCGATGGDVLKWANAIEQAMLEKETWLSPSCYEELMRERQETLYEMALLRAEVERLRALIVTAYQAAYSRGHEDTVEGCVNLDCIHERECAEEFINDEEDVLAMLATLNTEAPK